MTDKSIAQRALDANYAAARLSQEVHATYWLASCHEPQAECSARGRMADVEKLFGDVAAALGYRIERIEPVPVEEHSSTEAA
jgi:hypothetical protein